MATIERRLALFLLSVLLALPVAAVAGQDQVYQYRVSWNGIPAARATVALTEGSPEDAITRVRIQIQTNSFVDLFWSLRAESSAEVDAATLQPHRFRYDRRINGRPELTEIEAETDGLLTGRYARPGRYELIEVNDAAVLDPIAAVLHARRDLPAIGDAATYEVFTGENRYRFQLHRQPSEVIDVPAGRFTAARIEPAIWRVDRNARDSRVRRVTLWVTEAAPHTLLRVRSEVFIGAVYIDLTEW